MKYLSKRDFFWIVPLAFALGAVLSFLQPGSSLTGWSGFSGLLLLTFALLTLATRWGGLTAGLTGPLAPVPGRTAGFPNANTLAWIVALAFALRLASGLAIYLALPIDGHDDEDDRAGFVYTDAHRRDVQAWELASSDRPVIAAFTDRFAYDQYGGLLALSAMIYRYLSPDTHRPLMLVLVSAFSAALGLPFLWKAANRLWGGKIALISCWVFALFPEGILLGSSAMREPYLTAFSAMALWGMSGYGVPEPSGRTEGKLSDPRIGSLLWLGLGIAGMLLVSPAVALATIILLTGWVYFTGQRGRISGWIVVAAGIIFVGGLFIFSAALNRQGNLGEGTPVGIIGAFWREAVKWDVYQLERGSGWVQRLFNHMPEWLRLPFVMVYGVFQPVLPATFVEPTTLTWRIIGILRALGWWSLLPVLVFAPVAAAGNVSDAQRRRWMWVALFAWTWILLTALRGGGDQWDNPRYRAIMFLWQALLAGYASVRWQETRSPWLPRIVVMEVIFLVFFSQWYANRYYHFGPQLEFWQMVAFIVGAWVLVFLGGWLWDGRQRA